MSRIIDEGTLLNVWQLNSSKILNLFSGLKKKCLSGLEFTKCLLELRTGKTLIRLLFQKQSDLGLHCLSRPFWQTISV